MFKLKGSLHSFYKKALAAVLSLSIVVMTFPTALKANAATMNDAGNPAFSVTTYDTSARIEIPAVENAARYRVYMSQSKDADLAALTADMSARCVFSSDTYKSYDYVLSGDADELNSANIISINQNTTYYFYLVTNDGNVDTLQGTITAFTKETAFCYWTSIGHYDISWYMADPYSSTYMISTEEQLAGVAVLNNGLNGISPVDFSGKTIIISESLDLSSWLWTPIGTELKPFKGSVSGVIRDVSSKAVSCTHTIKGLHTNKAYDYQGLFGYVGGASTITNMGVVDGYVQGDGHTAGLVGWFQGTAIQNCYNTCSVSGKNGSAGGIVGSTLGNINNCYNTGNISSTYNTGGVAGYSHGEIVNCYNTGAVSGCEDAGGIVGCIRFSKSRLYACCNTGDVTASYMKAGGIAGCSEQCPIDSCYNSGSVYSDDYAAGIVGAFHDTGYSLSNSYNSGSINGAYTLGGICGIFSGDSIDNCYNVGNVIDTPYSDEIAAVIENGGTVNYCYYNKDTPYPDVYGNTYGEGKTPAELKALAGTLGTAFVSAPAYYVAGGVFSSSNPVNGGYPVLTAFGYTGGLDIDSQFERESGTGCYLVKNAYQLDLMRNYCGSGNSGVVFKLAGNMDLSKAVDQYNLSWQPIGSGSNPFCAAFNGNGYSISGVTITGWNFYQGLFGYNSGTIENLGVTGVNITSWCKAGGIAGYNTGIISNCSSTGILCGNKLGDDIGGIVGYSEGSGAKVSGCSNACTVIGDGWIGGIIGYNRSTVADCSNSGLIMGIKYINSPGDASEIGGIVGVSSTYNIIGCHNKGTICGNRNIGGIAGYLTNIDGGVSSCSNTGSIFGKSQTGGIVGYIQTSDILKKCHNEGTVTGYTSDSTDIGGIAGKSSDTIQSCCNTGTVIGGNTVGGIAGTMEYRQFTYCYNTGIIIGNNSAGGIAGGGSSITVSYSYNTGMVNSAAVAGGIVGTGTGFCTINCSYSTGTILANTAGGIAGSISQTDWINNNSYLGCSRSIGSIDNKNQGGKPFAVLASDYVKAASNTCITQQNYILDDVDFSNQLGADFSVSYSGYQSDNTDVAAVSNLTVSGKNVGLTAITGTVIIVQNELSMQDDSGFTGVAKTIAVPVSMPLTVTKATPAVAVSVSSDSVTVGDTLTLTAAISNAYDPSGTVAFYNNGTSIGSTNVISYGVASVSYIPTSAGSLSITAGYSGDGNNEAASGNTQNVTVAKQSPALTTVTAVPSSTQTYPVTSVLLSTTLSNYYGQMCGQVISFYDGETYLGTAMTDSDGEAVYTLANPGADTYQFTAQFGGDSNNNTAETNISTDYTINKGTQSDISINGVPSSVTYGDTDFTLSPSGGSGTDNTYTYFSDNEDVLSVDADGTVSINEAGDAVITVTKAGDENYNSISKDISIKVAKKTLDTVITPNNKQYDAAMDATVKTIAYTGLVGSDDVYITGGTLSFEDNTAANSKQVTASNYVLGGTKAANYSLGAVDVKPADITKKELTVSVMPVVIDCGQSIPSLSVEVSGFAPGENENNVAGFVKPTASTLYHSPTTSPINGISLPVTYSDGNASNNYEFGYSYTTNLTIRAVAVNDADYQVSGKYAVSENPSDWNTGDFTITPSNGYNLISADGTTWVSNLIVTSEGQNCSVIFKLKKTTDGTQTENNTIYYNLDKTVPTNPPTGGGLDLIFPLALIGLGLVGFMSVKKRKCK